VIPIALVALDITRFPYRNHYAQVMMHICHLQCQINRLLFLT
jgi:hypothetical protein